MRIEQLRTVPVTTQTEKVSSEASPVKPANSNRADVFESHASTFGIKGHYEDLMLSNAMKEIKEKRDEYKSAFQEVEEKQQETYEKLAELMKTLSRLRSAQF